MLSCHNFFKYAKSEEKDIPQQNGEDESTALIPEKDPPNDHYGVETKEQVDDNKDDHYHSESEF